MKTIDALAKALHLSPNEIGELKTTGLAHKHYRVGNRGKLARVPIHSQHDHAPEDNLLYQAACFDYVSASGHGPKLFDTLPVTDDLPMGALIVEEIKGRHAKLPDDLPAIANCLATIHNLPVRISPPLAHHANPIEGIRLEIEEQAQFLEQAHEKALSAELNWMRSFNPKTVPEPTCLVCTDTHPGNILIDLSGKAIIVDLEKVLFGSPSVDLAHTTVYTSTTWDLNSSQKLCLEEIQIFYATYLEQSNHADLIRPWLIPMRRLLSLRALTWCAMWLSQHKSQKSGWSSDHVPDTLTQHVFERVNHYLTPEIVEMNLAQTLELKL